MNIFYLDRSPVLAAQYQCDKHVVKMILETAQLLSTAHHVVGAGYGVDVSSLYRKTHVNHPSAVWVRDSVANYQWTFKHFHALLDEYEHRYNRVHATSRLWETLNALPNGITTKPFVEPPKCMPDDCKKVLDTVTAYRLYYVNHKSGFARWTNRPIPKWFQQQELELS